MVIVDLKGELVRKQKAFLSEAGYAMPIIDLRRPQDSPDKWNPMGCVEKSFAQGKSGEQKAILELNDLIENVILIPDQNQTRTDIGMRVRSAGSWLYVV